MTVKGLDLLHRADAVLYDALVNPRLLREAPATAELVDVGKRAGRHRMSQAEINQLLIELAFSCQTVVRLKGGDPFVFGRGGEELAALKAAGVPVEVVPGVTSAVAALAYAGVPVTQRHLAANFAVVTGHRVEGEDEGAYWSALARLDTLVILMGMRKLSTITERLIEAGRDPDTPALAVRWGTMPEQEVVTASLVTLPEQVARANLTSPAVVVVGAVAALADNLHWFPAQQALESVYC
jgi:uroporphyrin-III C-methyltransferase